jgi:hypothetical protein
MLPLSSHLPRVPCSAALSGAGYSLYSLNSTMAIPLHHCPCSLLPPRPPRSTLLVLSAFIREIRGKKPSCLYVPLCECANVQI